MSPSNDVHTVQYGMPGYTVQCRTVLCTLAVLCIYIIQYQTQCVHVHVCHADLAIFLFAKELYCIVQYESFA